MPLNLLHLSDIHFKYKLDGLIHDLDNDVRNELVIDVEDIVKCSGPIDAVVVTGDIAFAGKKADYVVAQNWLKELCEKVGCEVKNVWVVPGNHDVDRDEVAQFVRMAQDSIQTAECEDIDNKIYDIAIDPAGEELLRRPMAEYFHFAAIFGCAPKQSEIAWQSNLELGEEYILRFVGINSAIVSNNSDHETDRKLVVGRAQLKLPRKRGVLYLTLCHHPLEWLRDAESVDEILRNRVSLQLFGHVHRHGIQQDGRTLVVQAGALHPDRHESHRYPSYNVLSLEINTDSSEHRLAVTAYPRVWSNDKQHFQANPVTGESAVQVFSLPIDDKLSLAQSSTQTEEVNVQAEDIFDSSEGDIDMSYGMNDPSKQLVYAFLTLPYPTQLRIANNLELLSDSDSGLASNALFEQIVVRAKENGVIADLWEQVKNRHPDLNMDNNPYDKN